jgi:uncharacterized protein YkwD
MKMRPLDRYQKAAMGLMGLMVLLTFALTNLQAVLWQASNTLVSAVLPSVVVDLTNDERDDVAAPPLRRNPTLDAAAELKAEHMADNGYFAHFAPDGTSPWHWFDEVGYVYAHAGENLAIHFTDSTQVVEAWMDSPLHRANIVDSKYTEIGVGTARGRFNGHRTVFVVQLFGTPALTPAPVEVASVPSDATALPPEVVETVNESSVATLEPEPVPTEPSAVAAAEVDLETTIPPAPDRLPVAPVSFEPIPITLTDSPDLTTARTEQSAKTNTLDTPAASPIFDTFLARSSMVATSSGLAVAKLGAEVMNEPVSFVALATQPNTVMQVIYLLIALAVFVLLVLSFVNELRHAHPVQVGYSVAMLLLMSGLYWLHTSLTEGAIVV